jgi:cytochrome b pre-mRNA-processing protein 3
MREEARQIYRRIAEQARLTVFYTALGVPDSIDGRFDLLCVHAHAVFHRLRGAGEQADQLSQAIYDAMFEDLDGALREIGVADLGVGRRIKIMTEGLKGRIAAYDGALAGSDEAVLRAVIARNLYGTVTTAPQPEQVAAMARYLRDLRVALAAWPVAELLAGKVVFPAPPQGVEEAADATR